MVAVRIRNCYYIFVLELILKRKGRSTIVPIHLYFKFISTVFGDTEIALTNFHLNDYGFIYLQEEETIHQTLNY